MICRVLCKSSHIELYCLHRYLFWSAGLKSIEGFWMLMNIGMHIHVLTLEALSKFVAKNILELIFLFLEKLRFDVMTQMRQEVNIVSHSIDHIKCSRNIFPFTLMKNWNIIRVSNYFKWFNYQVIFSETGQWDKQAVISVFYLPRALTIIKIIVVLPYIILGMCIGNIFLPVCYSSLALFDLYWRFFILVGFFFLDHQ